ncbi:hypothetical protein [Pelagibius sp. Alg239-R121]|uniref:hypothetical protein n=1 Tax=Pelagibius sp. Alg239-R121 TaxID=2993448 RepID=UPI0024A6B16E|nr:hypothetical protein [Pelagibius sp. Alg239-R121]
MTRILAKTNWAGWLMASFATVMLLLPVTLKAADKPTAAELTEAVSDHTYQGSMSAANSGFAEYYAPDGAIRADGYTGKWRVEDGLMCFQYGDKPERCFGVELHGPSMTMFKDGEIDGNGMLIPGNPSKF